MKIKISGRSWRRSTSVELYKISMLAFGSALAAADPSMLVRKSVKLDRGILSAGRLKLPLARFRRVYVLGGGKATAAMATEVERLLGDRITDGAVNVPDYLPFPRLNRIRAHPATHPYPTQKGVEGVREMLNLADGSRKGDLFLCLFSGGGSSLMPSPADGVRLEDKVATTKLLLESGADIGEMNVVRRHLSSFKGGRLAEKLRGTTVVSLVISDVPGDRFDTVSSGPTAPDSSTFAQARKVLVKYHIWNGAPRRVRALIVDGERGKIPETPKPGSPVFNNVHNILIGSNRDARLAAYRFLKTKGFATKLRPGFYQGEAGHVGEMLAKEFHRQRLSRVSSIPQAMVAGGEATVVVRGTGKGGRDQELVLSAARFLYEGTATTFATLATDGVDGPTNAAGAIADNSTVARGLDRGLDPVKAIKNNDSNGYFGKLGGLLSTGPTGTNVNDVVIALSYPEKD